MHRKLNTSDIVKTSIHTPAQKEVQAETSAAAEARSQSKMTGIGTNHHSSDVQGLRGVHLTQPPQGLGPAPATHTLLVLALSILDQTSTNCHLKAFKRLFLKKKHYTFKSIFLSRRLVIIHFPKIKNI